MLKSGDHVVVSDNTYGGTFRLDKVLTRYDLSFTYVDTSQLDEIERAMTPNTDAVCRDADQSGDADHRPAGRRRSRPPSRRPARRRQHVREPLHPTPTSSARPGDAQHHQYQRHSDSIGGIVVAVRTTTSSGCASCRTRPYSEPFDSFLVLRGTKTLALRCSTTSTAWRSPSSSARTQGQKVYYPGLPTHPHYELAKRQMRGFGGMLAFSSARWKMPGGC
jgi:cystathionine gamma-lyase/cystathionine beta-lyase/cystathionine gamma-lyase/homocysteine desulfhydrase